MNLKGISVIVGVAAVILLVVLLPIKPGDVPPPIEDIPELGGGAAIGLGEEDMPELSEGATIGLGEEDTPAITESVIISETGPDFYVDEKGIRHYVINATDVIIPQE